jgi:hypothetical protein
MAIEEFVYAGETVTVETPARAQRSAAGFRPAPVSGSFVEEL